MSNSSLSLRIYALGVFQIAVVLLGFAAVARWERPPPPDQMHAQELALADAVEAELDRPAAVLRLLERALAEQQLEAEAFDGSGHSVASTLDGDADRCPQILDPAAASGPPPGPPPGGPRPFCYALSLKTGDGTLGKLVVRRTMPGATSPFAPSIIILTLVTVAITSWLLTRWLVQPLRSLGDAARSLGQGQLDTRTGIVRSDEFGEVARAFDTMAARVTELVRGERELIANISHEFRTPMARIRVALDLGSEATSLDHVQESLRDIVEDLDELEQLVADVLESARPVLEHPAAPGTPTLHRRPVKVADLVAASVERFTRLYPTRALELGDGEPAAGVVEGDPMLLRRMLDNVLDNAHKFSPEPDTAVHLGVALQAGALVFEIRDKGVGVSQTDLGRVFEPFFRADPSRTRATGGTGLGLGLARRIAQAHGGQLKLESTLGEGTRVRLQLPLSAPVV